MCGIFGTVNYRISKDVFQQQLNKLSHRGPDGFGIWENKDQSVKLGHRRLAIIDTDSRSNQPMLFADRYAIVFNGEIYNYVELKKELEKKGIVFQTASDTEVLFRLLIQEGPAALNKLNGMWSFVLYDEVEKTLFMSRDRIGKKPLYYLQQNDQFAFSSEMKSLYQLTPSFSYNLEFIDYAVANPFDNERLPDTIIHGIQKFPAGSYGIWKNGKLEIKRFYFPEQLLEQKRSYRNFNEAVEQFRELFESSCTLRMRSDVPVGSALSGGIDSGIVVSTIGKLGYGKKGEYTALISSFPGSALDETKEAMQVAEHANVPAVKVTVNPDLSPDHILEAIYDFEEMYLTAPVSFFQSYKGFRENGIVVTLDGHGGDELFGGYPFDMDVKLKDDFPNLLRMRNTLTTIHNMYGHEGEMDMRNAWMHFKGELLQKIKARKPFSVFEKEQYYKQKLFHSTFKGILPTLLRNFDRYSMHAGVEVRMPFLDYRMIEFAFSLPNDYKVRNGFSKAVVREAARGIVPDAILDNKLKSGWNSPMGEWMSGNWKQWLLDEVHSNDFRQCTLINSDMLLQQVEQFYTEARFEHSASQQLWLQLQPYFIEKANKKYAGNTGIA